MGCNAGDVVIFTEALTHGETAILGNSFQTWSSFGWRFDRFPAQFRNLELKTIVRWLTGTMAWTAETQRRVCHFR